MPTPSEEPDRISELREAWSTNQRINVFLIEQISEEGMRCTLSKHGGRDVAGQFAHLHNIRIAHLEKRASDLAVGLTGFEGKTNPSKDALIEALNASGSAIGRFLEGVLLGEPKRRGFKKGIFTTLSYLVAHESHHRGSILLTLKGCGQRMSTANSYKIWGWDQM